MIAPILAFTSEEIWAAMPHRAGHDSASVLLNDMPSPDTRYCLDAATEDKWEKLLGLRGAVNKALELARADKVIGKPLDAEVTVYLGDGADALAEAIRGERLDALFIVSKVSVIRGTGEGYRPEELPGVAVSVRAAAAPMCARCWTHDEAVGKDARYDDLCPRCSGVVSQIRGEAGE
jgi:isoleucyl-tRNA synthetase